MDSKEFDAFMRKCMNEAPTPDDGRYINPKAPKVFWYDALKNEVEKAQVEKQYKITYKMKKEDIMTFVSGLHDLQLDMIETVVIRKEREGFPEATAVINHIMEKK
jgi:hypothetical protein